LDVHDAKTREELRRRVVEAFLEEQPGEGRPTKYHYVVETLMDGRKIYLRRPTRRRSFDFEVWVEKWARGEDIRPGYDKITCDLKNKLAEGPAKSETLYEAITRAHQCEEPDSILKDYPDLSFKKGENIELILKTLKWMFIEEDIHYWNYSGRNMLKSALDSIFHK